MPDHLPSDINQSKGKLTADEQMRLRFHLFMLSKKLMFAKHDQFHQTLLNMRYIDLMDDTIVRKMLTAAIKTIYLDAYFASNNNPCIYYYLQIRDMLYNFQKALSSSEDQSVTFRHNILTGLISISSALKQILGKDLEIILCAQFVSAQIKKENDREALKKSIKAAQNAQDIKTRRDRFNHAAIEVNNSLMFTPVASFYC